jgi:hypothetical protein
VVVDGRIKFQEDIGNEYYGHQYAIKIDYTFGKNILLSIICIGFTNNSGPNIMYPGSSKKQARMIHPTKIFQIK